MKKQDSNNYWVSRRNTGEWAVKRENNDRATRVYDTQRDAIDHARDLAKNGHGELFIKDRSGQIRERNSYGNDPYPPKG